MRTVLPALILLCLNGVDRADGWKDDPVWHDGLVEKAVYSASRVVYGHPRPYEAIFFTNKESHDRKTLTKAAKSTDTIDVWKHNQVEDIPTPNYHYHYVTTTHLAENGLSLLRLDCGEQEFCGTCFKQYLRTDTGWDYWSFSYLPEAGRRHDDVHASGAPLVAFNSLPLWLREYDFVSHPDVTIALLPDQRSNKPTASQPAGAKVHFAGEDGGLYRLQLLDDADKVLGTFGMAKDRLHVMVTYRGADGQQYDLKSLARVNYWTIKGE